VRGRSPSGTAPVRADDFFAAVAQALREARALDQRGVVEAQLREVVQTVARDQ
jgi:hypothetical protein